MVSHHPPISAFSCQGEGYDVYRVCETVQAFNGKTVKVFDQNQMLLDLILNGNTRESYVIKDPTMVAGNLFVGERYVEP